MRLRDQKLQNVRDYANSPIFQPNALLRRPPYMGVGWVVD